MHNEGPSRALEEACGSGGPDTPFLSLWDVPSLPGMALTFPPEGGQLRKGQWNRVDLYRWGLGPCDGKALPKAGPLLRQGWAEW